MTNFDRKAIVREVCAYICVYLQRDATAPGKERAVLGPNTAKRITQQYVRDNLQQYKLQPLLSSVIPMKHSDGLRWLRAVLYYLNRSLCFVGEASDDEAACSM